jgi:hypothetical protein
MFLSGVYPLFSLVRLVTDDSNEGNGAVRSLLDLLGAHGEVRAPEPDPYFDFDLVYHVFYENWFSIFFLCRNRRTRNKLIAAGFKMQYL